MYVRVTNRAENHQKRAFPMGKNFFDAFLAFVAVSRIRDTIDMAKATTPPNLFGIDRKMA